MFGRLFGSGSEKELSSEVSAKLLKPALNSSHDAIIVIKNRETILFSNHIMKKIYLAKNGSPLDDLQDHILFYTPVTKDWSPLENLIEYHDEHNAPEPTLFVGSKMRHEREIDGLSIQIRSVGFEQNRDIYHIVTIHTPLRESSGKADVYHNALTGLPNQNRAFADIAVLTANVSSGHHFALMIVEIDNFTKLRSLLGYNEMNNLVVLFANRLKELAKDERYDAYQLMHENFLLILHGVETSREIYDAADHINAILEPMRHKSPTTKGISFSAGVSKFPQNGTLETLLDSAYNALNEAEERGEGQLVISTASSKKLSQREVLMSGDIKEALLKREFHLYFQPIYDQPYHKIAGAEVLIRWNHPERGMIMPDSFIPLAEKSGLIVDISVYVLSEALKQLKNWKTFGFKPIELAVNLSAKDLESDEFLDNMKELLGRYDISPFKLKVEVTEHASMMNPEMTHKKLLALKEMGLKISLDDFGTGYSSYAYLADFPIDSLKIDKGFIQDISVNEKHQNIVESMVKLAHTLGMNVIAEGVEREKDLKLLMGYGTDFFQGYYFSKPVPLLEFQHLMNQDDRR